MSKPIEYPAQRGMGGDVPKNQASWLIAPVEPLLARSLGPHFERLSLQRRRPNRRIYTSDLDGELSARPSLIIASRSVE